MTQELTDFLEELKHRPEVLGVILFGSWARGNQRPDSDIDLVVILTEGYRRTVEYRNQQAFELIYVTEEEAFEFWESHPDDAFGLWEVAKILYDKDGRIAKLRRKVEQMLQEGKKPVDEFQLGQMRFDAEDLLRYIENILVSDPTSANFILTNKIFALTEVYFVIRQMWIPAPKQRLEKIMRISPEMYSLLKGFYQESTPLKEKLSIARKMIPFIFETE